jgi:hypothetical protein
MVCPSFEASNFVCALTDDMTMSSCGAVTVRRVGPEQKRVVAVAVTGLCRGAGERGCGRLSRKCPGDV